MLAGYIIEKTRTNNIPLSVSFELTYRCNVRCLMCYQTQTRSIELTTEEVKSIISQLADAGCLYLTFTGGEPLLREDFWEIAKFAKNKSFALVLQTNATLIGPEEARKLKQLGFLQVHISILGATDKTHDEIMQMPGAFKKAIQAAKLLLEQEENVIFKTTLINKNFAEYKKIKEIAEEIGAKPYFSPVLFPKNNKEKTPLEYRLNDNDLKQLFCELADDDTLPEFNSAGELALCNMGRTECNINPKGEIYPCVSVPIILGSLREKSFQEIWQNSQVLKRIRQRSQNDILGCQNCESASTCILCPGLSLTEEKDLFSKASECCRITKIIKEVCVHEKEKI